MTVAISKPAMNLRAELARGKQPYRQSEFWFTAGASQSVFTLPKGWTVARVYGAASNYRPGTGWDYTTSFDGFAWSITFAVAPATGASIGILGEQKP